MLAAQHHQPLGGLQSRRRVASHHVDEARQPQRVGDARLVP
jgi:hypothetical protein